MKNSMIAACVFGAMCGVGICFWATSSDVFAQPQAPQPRRTVDLKFQYISKDKLSGNLFRTAVLGGWLVVLESAESEKGPAMVFIPDPKHEWDGKSIPPAEKQ